MDSRTSKGWEVLIAGGGPAGATVATLLARRGVRCLVVDSSVFPRYHIGESLAPGTNRIFQEMGFLSKLEASSFPEKRSVRFVSADGRTSYPFHFSDLLPPDQARTWQVERSTFDQMLLNHARDNGVDVWEDSQVAHVSFEGDCAIGAEIIRHREQRVTVPAQVVVDASGRGCLLGRQLGFRTLRNDLRKASIWGYYQGGQRGTGFEAGETTIFLIPDGGWFWHIPLPDDVVSVGVVGPNERLFRQSKHPEVAFHQTMSQCPALLETLDKARMTGKVLSMNQLAYANSQTSGHGWIMIGDARAFLDPIYSSGLFLALSSAGMAANTIQRALQSANLSAETLGAFEPVYNRGVEAIRHWVHAFYDPGFNVSNCLGPFPEQRLSLARCLVGNVFENLACSCLEDLHHTPSPPLIA